MGGTTAGFRVGVAKWLPGFRATNPLGCSLFVSHCHGLRHLGPDYGDPVEYSLCSGDLCRGSLLRDLVDHRLDRAELASEDFRVVDVISPFHMPLPGVLSAIA